MTYIPPEPLVWNYCPMCGRKLEPVHDGESIRPHCVPCRRFFYRNPVPATCGFVRREDGALLLAQRGVEPCKGHWSLPGGYMELGESPDECIVRELREETGLEVTRVKLLGAKTKPSPINGAILVLGFLAEAWSGEPRAGSDVLAARFFFREERPDMAFTVHKELLAIYDAQYA